MKRLLAITAAALAITPSAAHATGLTVIGFDDISSDGVPVTNQYAPLGVDFGSNSDFGLNAYEHGCGAPITGSDPQDYDGGGRWIEPHLCGSNGFAYTGTALSFSWAHSHLTLFARALPGYAPTIRFSGYAGGNPFPVATISETLSANYWSQVTLDSTTAFDKAVIDSPDAVPAPEFILDSLQLDAGISPIALSVSEVTPTAASPFTGKVGHFTDGDSTAVASDYTAQITWGDGASSTGAVTAAAAGGFDVSGTHTYAAGGTDQLTVSVTKTGRSAIAQTGTIQVAAAQTSGGGSTGGGSTGGGSTGGGSTGGGSTGGGSTGDGSSSGTPAAGPQAAFSVSPNGPFCGGQTIQFDASASTPGSSPIVSYQWKFYPSPYLPGDALIPDPTLPRYFEPVPQATYQTTSGPFMAHTYNYVLAAEDPIGEVPLGAVIPDGGGVRLTVTDANGLRATVAHPLDFTYPYIDDTSPVPAAACTRPVNLTAPPSFPSSTPATVHSSQVSIPVACSGGAAVCGGLVTLTAATGGARLASIASAPGVIGRGRFTVAGSRRAIVRIALNARGRMLERRHRLHRIRVTVSTLHIGGGTPRTVSHTFSIHN
jgi:hypothetical protein